MKTVLHNGKIFTGDALLENAAIIVEQDVITAITNSVPVDAKHIDLEGLNIAPGFIDIQLNGGYKYYFSARPTEETLHDMCHAAYETGTTELLPCLISSDHEHILKAIDTVKHYMHTHNEGVFGMHLEGPFINPLKRGAHPAEFVRKPTNSELDEIIRYGRGVIKVMTIAPECFSDEQLDMLLASDFIVSAGHSAMTYEQAQYYFSKGIKLVTHLYNAMTQMQHREPGMVGAALNNDTVYAPIILDGGHCDYAAAQIAWKIKKDKLLLISDAAFLGRRIEKFSWGAFDANLRDTYYRNSDGNLAGAAISMTEAVQNAVKHVGIPLKDAINMATVNAAKAVNMDDKIGRIAPGYMARFVVFNDDLSICKTMIV